MTLDIPNDWGRRESIVESEIQRVSRVQSDDFKFQKEHTLQFLLPLNCTTYATNQDGVNEAHAVAVRFQATILKQNIAFLGYRIGPLHLIPGSLGDRSRSMPARVGGAIIIGRNHETRPWTVYFPQKGL